MSGILDRRLLFVTGKGGVGKTTVAAALGVLATRVGKRVLLCEVDAKGDLAVALECGELSFTPRNVLPGLRAMAMSTEDSLKEYLRVQAHLPLVARIGPLARSLDFVANAAPGVREILNVGKLAWEVRERHYDLVVVDAAASGHIVSQLAAPRTIGQLVKVGAVREQTRWMRELLSDPEVTAAVIVTIPGEMPVAETIELCNALPRETDVDCALVVVNRVLPELFGRGEEAVFESLREDGSSQLLAELVGPAVTRVLDGAALAVELRRSRAEHLTRLRAAAHPRFGFTYVPELFGRKSGMRSTQRVADALGEELL